MPAADHLVNFDFDDGFEQQQSSPPVNTPPSSNKKSKKKKAKNKGDALPAAQPKIDEEEETPYAKSVTPSPPTPNGVRLQGEATPPTPAQDSDPVPPPAENFDDDDILAWEESPPSHAEPAPEVKATPPPTAHPARSSPIQPPTKPAQDPAPYPRLPLPNSPQRRVSTLYGSPGTYGTRNPQIEQLEQNQQRHPEERVKPRVRRESYHAAPRPRIMEPPPPHMPQPHFMGLPDWTGKLLPQQNPHQQGHSGKKAGSDGYCCCFDSFSDSGDSASAKKAKDALLVGWKGGLDIYRVLEDKMEVIGRLEGLRGGVIGARILPGVGRGNGDGKEKPVVVVVVHGPMDREEGDEEYSVYGESLTLWQTTVEVFSLDTQMQMATLYKGAPQDVHLGTNGLPKRPEPVGDIDVAVSGQFVTISSGVSGEVYVFTQDSDTTQRFRCIGKFWTLIQTRLPNQSSRPGSGSDGMFEGEEKKLRGAPLLSLSPRWLALCPPATTSSISIQGSPLVTDANPQPFGVNTHVAPPQPHLSCEVAGVDEEGTFSKLSRQAAQGLVQASQKGYILGMEAWKELTHPSPPSGQQPHHHNRGASHDFPPTNAPHDDPRRLAREPTVISIIDLQRLHEADEHRSKHSPAPLATFALTEGCNYLSFSPNGLRILTSNRKGEVTTIWNLSQIAHASPSTLTTSTTEPDISSVPCIQQVHRIPRSSTSVLLSCVWNSDSNRVALLTANGTIHLHEIPASKPLDGRKRRRNPSVSFNGKGLFGQTHTLREKAQPTVGVSAGLSPPSGGGYLGSLKGAWGKWGAGGGKQAQPQRDNASAIPQDRSPPVQAPAEEGLAYIPTHLHNANNAGGWTQNLNFAGFRQTAAAAGGKGSRAVAKGLWQGLELARGGVEEAWRSEENKIRVKELGESWAAESNATTLSEESTARGSLHHALRWFSRSGSGCQNLAVAAAGKVALHPVERVERFRGEERFWALRQEKGGKRTFALPLISTPTEAFTPAGSGNDKRNGDIGNTSCEQQGPHGFWLPASLGTHAPLERGRGRGHRHNDSASAGGAAEVETNPPYCPFHIDYRVGIFAFFEPSDGADANGPEFDGKADVSVDEWGFLGHGVADEPAWVFGQAMPAGVRMNEEALCEGEYAAGAGAFETVGGGGVAALRLRDYDEVDEGDGNGFADRGGRRVGQGFDLDDDDESVDGDYEDDGEDDAATAPRRNPAVRSILTVSKVSGSRGYGRGSKVAGGREGDIEGFTEGCEQEEEEIRGASRDRGALRDNTGAEGVGAMVGGGLGLVLANAFRVTRGME
ncbi:hypothetical protein MBLNU230_g2632t1 [Neophaeotheca triangularis]